MKRCVLEPGEYVHISDKKQTREVCDYLKSCDILNSEGYHGTDNSPIGIAKTNYIEYATSGRIHNFIKGITYEEFKNRLANVVENNYQIF